MADNSIKIKDSRYPINITIDSVEEFTLYFNPADLSVLEFIKDIESLKNPENSSIEEISDLTKKITITLDTIFNDGAAKLIYRYNDYKNSLLIAIMEKLREGYNDFEEKAENEKKEQKREALITAKKEGSPYAVT